MRKEFVMRGQTVPGNTEVLNFSGYKPGYAYRLVEFSIYPSTGIGSGSHEMVASITAGKTAMDPTDVDFNDAGLIGSVLLNGTTAPRYPIGPMIAVINDTFLITQNLLLKVADLGGNAVAVNWQCRFVAEKMSGPEEAVANYKQYTISS